MRSALRAFVLAVAAFGFLVSPAGAEIVEEIVAWINGEVITLSEYKEEEQGRIAEIYRRFSGEELDAEVERARKDLLLAMIDRRILVHHARALGYDIDKMGDSFLESFMAQQNIGSIAELERMAEADGMSLERIKTRLVGMYAPEEVVRMEVTNRISIAAADIGAFYESNAKEFFVEGEVTLREIVLLADSSESKDQRRAEAREIHEKAVSGELFATLAREHSDAGTADKGGEFGPLKQGDLAESLVTPAFELPIGDVSDLMETPYGFHIIKVDSRVDAHTKPLDEVEDQIRSHLRDVKFRTELESFLEKARAESEWCVKPKHQNLLSVPAPPPCERL